MCGLARTAPLLKQSIRPIKFFPNPFLQARWIYGGGKSGVSSMRKNRSGFPGTAPLTECSADRGRPRDKYLEFLYVVPIEYKCWVFHTMLMTMLTETVSFLTLPEVVVAVRMLCSQL